MPNQPIPFSHQLHAPEGYWQHGAPPGPPLPLPPGIWYPDTVQQQDSSVADLINLNKARKARQREEAKAKAAENRIRYGQRKSDRDAARKEEARFQRKLDGKKLE